MRKGKVIIIKRAKKVMAAILAAAAALTGILSLSACGMDEEHTNDYEEVLQMALEEYGGQDWVMTGACRSWGMETPNNHDKYYFYIDNDKYYDYKEYWLEDVPKEKFREGFNKNLWETGDYVQHCINIEMRNNPENGEYMGIKLEKDRDYYVVSVYDKALYFAYLYDYKDADNYFRDCGFKVDEESCTAKVIYHKTENGWTSEKADLQKAITKNSDLIFSD